MFRAPLCPSSRAEAVFYFICFSAINVLTGVLGSREAGRVQCVEAVIEQEYRISRNVQRSLPVDTA